MNRLVWAVVAASLAGLVWESRQAAAEPANLFGPLGELGVDAAEPVVITARIEPGDGVEPDSLVVSATLEKGWHIYSITQPPGGPLATRISLADDSPRKTAAPFQAHPAPAVRRVNDVPAWRGLPIEEHSDRVTWRAPLESGTGGVRGTVRVQLCEDTACLPPKTVAFFAAGADSPPADPSDPPTVHRPERTHARLEARFGAARQLVQGRSWPLEIRIVPAEDWHLYRPASSGESRVGQGKPTIVAIEGRAAGVLSVRAAEAVAATRPELAEQGAVEGPVTLEVLLAAEPPDGEPVDLVIGFQTCSADTCDMPAAVRISVAPPAGYEQALIDFSPAKYGEAARSPVTLQAAAATAPSPAAGGRETPPSTRARAADLSLPLALLMGLAGGLILNLMPCVLPVLGLKLMSFAQQSGRARREVFLLNLWYCAGLFAVFLVLATASVAANIGLGSVNLKWGEQFTWVPFKVGMIAVVFAFGLSFLGVWELPVPGFIGEKAGHVQSQEGPAGAFLKGVLSTVLATPCSGPFLGTVLAFTQDQPTAVVYAVFASIAAGMSLPYLLVGLFPWLVRFLPKPGAWMVTFKELLGFMMLGTVAFLFYQLENKPACFVPTFVMLIGIWLGCWWVGRVQERQGAAGFGHWLQAVAIGGGVGLASLLWLGPADSPIRRSLVAAVQPVRLTLQALGPLGRLANYLPSASPLGWEPFSPGRLQELRREGRTVLLDFSANWCLTCKANLQGAIETKRVYELVEKNRVVPVLADWTDENDEIRRALESLGSQSIPLLAIYPAAQPGGTLPEPIVLRDLLTERQVLDALEQAGPSCCPPSEIRAASAPAPAGR